MMSQAKAVHLHTDISTRVGERIMVFSLAGPVRSLQTAE